MSCSTLISLLFLIFNLFPSLTALPVVNSSYQVQSANLLGRDLTTANFRITFEEDFFFTLPSFCLAPKECPIFGESSEDFCDYSSEGDSCGVGNDTVDQPCKVQKYCNNAEYPWVRLSESDHIRGLEVEEYKTSIVRFYFNITQPCSGFRIKINRLYGAAGIGVSRGSYVDSQEPHDWDRFGRSTYFGQCPGSYNFGYGTYFIGVWSNSVVTKVDIDLEFFEINMTNQKTIRNESEMKCLDRGYGLCAEFGEAFTSSVASGFSKLVSIEISQCTQFMIYFHITSGPGTLALLFAQDKFPTSTGFSFPAPKHPFVLTICPPLSADGTPGSETVLWILLATEMPTLNFVFYLSNDPSEWSAKLVPLQELGNFGGREVVDGMVQLSCSGHKFPCFPGADTFGTCQQAWNPLPRKDGNFLWPIPRLFSDSLTDRILYEDPEEEEVFVGNEIRATLLLESYYKSQAIVPFPQWETELEQCILTFPSLSFLSTKDGQIPMGSVSMVGKKEEVECSVNQFEELSNKMNQNSAQFDKAKTINEIITLRYSTDVLTFESVWQACDQHIKSFLIEEKQLYLFPKSTTCSVDMMKNASLLSQDACCNEALEWSTCCQEREVQTNRTSYKIEQKKSKNQANEEGNYVGQSSQSTDVSAKTSVWEMCENPDCVNALLENYIFYEELIDSSSGCGAVVSETLESLQHSEMEFYRNCKEEIFGEDQKGKPCVSDSECQQIGGQECDIFRGKCVFLSDEQRQNRTTKFFQCLVDTMPTVIRNELRSHYGYMMEGQTGSEDDGLVMILERNFTVDDCDDDFGRSIRATGYSLPTNLGVENCGPSDWLCSDPTCDIPLYLEMKRQYGRPGSLCGRTLTRKQSRFSECSTYQVCNWNNSVTMSNQTGGNVEECQNSQSSKFCGHCSSSSFCVMVQGLTENECQKMGRVCFNGVNSYNLSIKDEQSCWNDWGVCSVNCSVGSDGLPTNICSQDECLATGRCSDQDVIGLESTFHPQNISREEKKRELNGVCISAMMEWNQVDCDRYASFSETENQPILIQDFPFDSFCVRNKNFTECTSPELADQGFWWYSAATNQKECEELKSCQESKINTQLRSVKDVEQCQACNAHHNSTFTWTQGKWQGGQMVPIEWTSSGFSPLYSWNKGVDFEKVSQFFLDALSRQFALQLVTELDCRVNPVRTIMESILCVCENGLEQCGNSLETVSLGVGELCLDTSMSLMAPPTIISFSANSLANETKNLNTSQCIEIKVFKLDQGGVDSSSESSISLTFRKRERSSENVWNFNDATIGKTIGDGIQLQFKSQVSQLTNVKLCLMAPSLEQETSQRPHSTVDIGVRVGTRIHPLGAIVTVDRDLICVDDFTVTQTQRVFFPILRDVDWETKETTSYSNSQLGVYSVMFVLYFIPFGILVFHQIVWGVAVSLHTRFFNFSFTLALLVRCMYFLGLLIAQPTGSESVAEFLAAEFPTIAYLSAVSGATMLWAIVKATRLTDLIQQIGAVTNIFLYSFFIVFAILFFELQGSGSHSCFRLLYSQPDQTDQDILRVVYYSILCFCALLLGSITTYFSGSMVKMFFGTSGTSNPRIKKWLVVTLVCSLSVVCQCIFALVYTLDISPSYQYALVLIVLEIIPACSIMYLTLSVEVNSSSPDKSNSVPQPVTLPDLNTKTQTAE